MEQILLWAERITGNSVTALKSASRAHLSVHDTTAVPFAHEGRTVDMILFRASDSEFRALDRAGWVERAVEDLALIGQTTEVQH